LQSRAVSRPPRAINRHGALSNVLRWSTQHFRCLFFNIGIVNVRQRSIFMEDNTIDGNIPQPVTSGTPHLWLRKDQINAGFWFFDVGSSYPCGTRQEGVVTIFGIVSRVCFILLNAPSW
jgi:hypothetical protein